MYTAYNERLGSYNFMDGTQSFLYNTLNAV
jgi:hypothetical protein